MSRKLEEKITFMINDKFSDLLAKVTFDLDSDKSSVIRACILLSIDTLKANPHLIKNISIDDRFSNQRSAR